MSGLNFLILYLNNYHSILSNVTASTSIGMNMLTFKDALMEILGGHFEIEKSLLINLKFEPIELLKVHQLYITNYSKPEIDNNNQIRQVQAERLSNRPINRETDREQNTDGYYVAEVRSRYGNNLGRWRCRYGWYAVEYFRNLVRQGKFGDLIIEQTLDFGDRTPVGRVSYAFAVKSLDIIDTLNACFDDPNFNITEENLKKALGISTNDHHHNARRGSMKS